MKTIIILALLLHVASGELLSQTITVSSATQTATAAKALGGNTNVSNGAYFWNASKPEKGFLWNSYKKGIL